MMTHEDSAPLQPQPTLDSLDAIDPAVLVALKRLKEAHDTASNFGRSSWDFAIEISQMGNSGIDNNVLRMMVCQQWVVHQREATDLPQVHRSFEQETELVFSARSCFVITKEGYRIATRLEEQAKSKTIEANRQASQTSSQDLAIEPTTSPHWSVHHSEPAILDSTQKKVDSRSAPERPVWDRQRRELRLGDVVVKRFKWPAENQERVLNAFEDQGWPDHIDDPLLPHPDICAKRRLHDTLKCLNRKQVRELIKFRGDGTGLGVRLEINLDA